MRNQCFNEVDTTVIKLKKSDDGENESSPRTKLERRRRIEELFEEKRLRDELCDFQLI